MPEPPDRPELSERRGRNQPAARRPSYPIHTLDQWVASNKVPFGLVSGRAPTTELILTGREIAAISFDADAAQRTFLLWIDTALNDLRTILQYDTPVQSGDLRNSQRISLGQKKLNIESIGFISSELNLEVMVEVHAIQYATYVRRYENYKGYGGRFGDERDWLSLSADGMVARHSYFLNWKQESRRK